MREAKRIMLYDADITLYPGQTKPEQEIDSLNNLLGSKIGDMDAYKARVQVSKIFAKVSGPKWIDIQLQGKVEDESFQAAITYCGSFSICWAEDPAKPKEVERAWDKV
jgi:hypothetical protein